MDENKSLLHEVGYIGRIVQSMFRIHKTRHQRGHGEGFVDNYVETFCTIHFFFCLI